MLRCCVDDNIGVTPPRTCAGHHHYLLSQHRSPPLPFRSVPQHRTGRKVAAVASPSLLAPSGHIQVVGLGGLFS